jgi:hypothetical protein
MPVRPMPLFIQAGSLGRHPISGSTRGRPFIVFLRRIPAWKIALIGVAVLALVVGLALVAGAVFLLLLPVILAAGLAHRLFGAKRTRAPRPSKENRDVIEGVYVSLSEERRTVEPPPGKRRD